MPKTTHPFHTQRILVAVWLIACSWGTSQAQTVAELPDASRTSTVVPGGSAGIRPDHLWTFDYLRLVLGDTTSVLSAPVHWGQEQWLEAAGAVGGVGVTAAFDHSIRTRVQAGRSLGENRFMHRWQNLNTLFILAGFEAWGELGSDTRAKNVAMDGFAASLIASGLITPGLKFIVGRERPSTTPDTFRFKPFSGNYSFPSGHATQAFAVATVIAENYPVWWVQGLAYGSAALVGYARIEQNDHYASDVVAGALIGWSVARAVVHRHNGPPDPRKLSWSPYTNGHVSGLVFYKSF